MVAPIVFGAVAKLALSQGVKLAIGEAVSRVASKRPIDKGTQEVVAEVVTDLAKNPVFINQTNSEKPIESRVTIGGAQGFIGGLAFLLPIILAQFGVQVNEAWLLQLFGAIMAVWGPLYTLWGRWAPDLKPLFSGTWGKVMGVFGLGSILGLIVLAIVVVLR